MKRLGYLCITLLLLTCFAALGSPASAVARSESLTSLDEMNLGLPPGQTLKSWYEAQSGNHGNDQFFGAYVTLPVGANLYLGLGSDLPARDSGDGAYFAVYNGVNLTGIAEPNEQGLHEMIYDGAVIHIAGTDPHPDDHTAGNHYIYPPGGPFIKYRDAVYGLKNVYHTWGLWKDGSMLYVAVSAHDGSDPQQCTYGVTCMGQIYTSTSNGAVWTKKSDLGGYRAYDVIGFKYSLYAISNDALSAPLSLSKSIDGGTTWQEVAGLHETLRRVHLMVFNNRLVALSDDRSTLYALSASGQITPYALPGGYLAGVSYPDASYTDYHIFAQAKGYLYLIAENPRLMEVAVLRTSDLLQWEEVVTSPQRLISLTYWADKDWLVAASAGSGAKLWRVDLWGLPTVVTLSSLRASTPAPLWPIATLFLLIGFINLSMQSLFVKRP
ncbi:MAG: hypothetical protein ACOY16_01810 [Chloroflexota bacterium]